MSVKRKQRTGEGKMTGDEQGKGPDVPFPDSVAAISDTSV